MTHIDVPRPQIDDFSQAYYLVGGLVVRPSSDTYEPVVHTDTYDWLRVNYYRGREMPILFRENTAQYHFQVHASDGVPVDVLELPYEMVDDMGIERAPDTTPLLMAKPRHVHNIKMIDV